MGIIKKSVAFSITILILTTGALWADAPVVWLWHENGLQGGIEGVSKSLLNAGLEVHKKTGGEIGASGLNKVGQPDLLVLPYGRKYPVEVARLLPALSKRGGMLLVTGGEHSFEMPVYQTDKGARGLTESDHELARVPTDTLWKLKHLGVSDRIDMQLDGGTALVLAKSKGFAYVGTEVSRLEDTGTILEFEMRSATGIRNLAVDLRTRDGLSWRYIVPVTAKWKLHRVHLGQFVPYNVPAGVSVPTYLTASHVARLFVGGVSSMLGKGERSFEVRNVCFLRSDISSSQVASQPRFGNDRLRAARWFSAQHIGESSEITDPLHPTILKTLAKDPHMAFIDHGLYRGSKWAFYDLSIDEGEQRESRARGLATTARKLATTVWQTTPIPLFRALDNKVVMDVKLPLQNPTAYPALLDIHLFVNGEKVDVIRRTLPARQTAMKEEVIATGVPSPSLTKEPFEIRVETTCAEGIVLGSDRSRLDLRTQLKKICDFAISSAREDNKLHGYTFIDNRGMRVLLGGYEIFGDHRYKELALRWGATIMAEQREDGGYRMGYGISSRGEECYVADGGEVLVAILRLTTYADDRTREALLYSADQYMSFRESFRVKEGGIGVGWCLSDYSKRPIVKGLPAPVKIFAPEVNPYTIGCTLGGAYLHARLRQRKDLLAMAAKKDAEWYMARQQRLAGAAAESFVYAHALADQPELRQCYAQYLWKALIQATLYRANKAWWLGGGGRTSLNLWALVYYANRIDNRADLQAEINRALFNMFSSDVPNSIVETIEKKTKLSRDDWIYINYGSLGLVDAIRPGTTMVGLALEKRNTAHHLTALWNDK